MSSLSETLSSSLQQISFNLREDLPLLAEHRVKTLAATECGDPLCDYRQSFEKSRELCQQLHLKDPKQIASIADLIALPNFAELVNVLMNIEEPKSSSQPFDFLDCLKEIGFMKKTKLCIAAPQAQEMKTLTEQIAGLTSLIAQSLVPVVEDYITLGNSKDDLERYEYFKKLLSEGIALNNDTYFKIQKNKSQKVFTFNIEQGKNSELVIKPVRTGLAFSFVNKLTREQIVLTANIKNQNFEFSVVRPEVVGPQNPFHFIPFDGLTKESVEKLKSIIENQVRS